MIFYSSSCQAGVKISLLVIWDVLLFEISPLELRITERLFWWKQFSMAFNYQWKNTTALSIRYYHGKKFRFLRLGCRDTWDRFKNVAVGAPSIGKYKIMISDVFVFFRLYHAMKRIFDHGFRHSVFGNKHPWHFVEAVRSSFLRS